MGIHVFLGPTLDLQTAQGYLPQAYYHPPVQCGDLIRLLRLAPKVIVLIDGLYEQVPAVWHKEIMLALDRGVIVYGAASMGALRAAELDAYGMRGVGKIFQDFLSGRLNDDDEVAVLHYGEEQGMSAINEAMVNIRATLEAAIEAKIITPDSAEKLVCWCKAQFYPKRSLQAAIKHQDGDYSKLSAWLKQHGVIDLKRADAIAVLQEVQTLCAKSEKGSNLPYTKFIASLVDDEMATPFYNPLPWLPEIERKIQVLSLQNPAEYKLIFELSRLLKNAFVVLESTQLLEEQQHYLQYIQANNLYYPEKLYTYLCGHEELSALYPWMLHFTCLTNSNKARVESYLPVAAFYFEQDLSILSKAGQGLLTWIIVLILLLNEHLDAPHLTLKSEVLAEHLEDLGFWRRYKQAEGIDLKKCLEFVLIYMKIIYIHQGFRDIKPGLATAPEYYNWIYDGLILYEQELGMRQE
ncbi:hypothetical protein BN59_01918 [Legionella massiliensis]|uniref:TfuA-like core domain-containing protein n=1 Tax=Legionella massiliensis TaxID=1034943 RepID=A0A078L0Q9_9GAMM|nr:TfuA-like protein [Legionella massiliensis]CDZ77634.1 hypothetical protein BN59_01918 [Legionella massiliensis]CEE13372.1 TfuA-like protein [Legionella massiliensis]